MAIIRSTCDAAASAILVGALAACGGASEEPRPAADAAALDRALDRADRSVRRVDLELLEDRIGGYRASLPAREQDGYEWDNCLEGRMESCQSLGDAYADGVGVEPDAEVAGVFYQYTRTLAEDYCERGAIHGCSQLGYMYYHGIGVAPNVERGVSLLRRGCTGGDDLACVFLDNENLPR